MQLKVFAGPVEQIEEAIDDLVFTDALVADKQQVLAQQEVLQHVLHHGQMLQQQTSKLHIECIDSCIHSQNFEINEWITIAREKTPKVVNKLIPFIIVSHYLPFVYHLL